MRKQRFKSMKIPKHAANSGLTSLTSSKQGGQAAQCQDCPHVGRPKVTDSERPTAQRTVGTLATQQ